MKETYIPLLNRIGIETDNVNVIHWIGVIACIILLFYISSLICQKTIIPISNRITRSTQARWDEIIFNAATLKNISNLLVGIALTAALPVLMYEDSMLHDIASKACHIYLIVIFAKLCCSVLTSFYKISSLAKKTRNHTIQGVFQMLKILVICIATIYITSIVIDKDPTRLLAGLGASAAVLMLVFKDSIMGLVAGVQLSANDMLRPGDWISMPKYGADGDVLEVTLTTVKVQNWDKTITTVPPYALVNDSFQNWRGMFDVGGRRVKRSINIDMNTVRFCTPEELAKYKEQPWMQNFEATGKEEVNLYIFRHYVEQYLRNHPKVSSEMIIMVRQLQPTAQGLPVELYFFSADTRWVMYEHLQAEVFDHVIAMLNAFDLKVFQSPSGQDLQSLS